MRVTHGVSAKILILLLALVLLIGCAAGGTLAWLMTKTDPVVNTFTVGNVAITLKEHVLNPTTGQWQTPETLTDVGNQGIQVLPGRTIQKDPTLTVLKGSEECYVRVLIKISWSEEADAEFAQFAYGSWIQFNSNWSMERIFDGTFITNQKYVGYDVYELRYKPGAVDATEADVKIPIINSMTFPGDLDNDQIAALEGAGITLIAQAVQAENFADDDAAFAAAGYPDGWDPETMKP